MTLTQRRQAKDERPTSNPSTATPAPQARAGEIPRRWLVPAVLALLATHYALAASSLLRENPTVDEVLHLPAGVSYWQKATFKLYRHNPPLVKLVAALPVVLSRPNLAPAYQSAAAWRNEYPSQARFGQYFLLLNVDRYFSLFARARLVMPLWSILGGLAVFFWARKLYGSGAGLLSLTLWCFCPNILAHARLVTSDAAAAAIGCAATFLFWNYLQSTTWRRAVLAGFALGIAQLVKFSSLLLYPLWFALWLIDLATRPRENLRPQPLARSALQGASIVALSVLVLDAGYLFEGVGTPLGRFSFASRSPLTRPGEDPRWRTNPSQNNLIDLSWKHRVNAFRGTWLESLPSPLPREFLMGFDEQKIETDGIPIRWIADEKRSRGEPLSPAEANAGPNDVTTYPVFLDGELRRRGWRDYYLRCLLYKVPEGSWALSLLAACAAALAPKARSAWRNELTLLLMPLAFLAAMSFLTDINIGIRYVLPIFPYIFIFCGKLIPWVESLAGRARAAARLVVAACLTATLAATLAIHPHYLAYFNWAAGGPARGSEHLIDSNLDWGQDLVGLRDWLARRPAEPVGLVYFGQISPTVLEVTDDGFPWFLPPAIHGRLEKAAAGPRNGPRSHLTPGLYAVSASIYRGLPWRLYEPVAPADLLANPDAWLSPSWRALEHAYAYFQELEPLPESIGHSILLFRLSEDDARRINDKYGFNPPIRQSPAN